MVFAINPLILPYRYETPSKNNVIHWNNIDQPGKIRGLDPEPRRDIILEYSGILFIDQHFLLLLFLQKKTHILNVLNSGRCTTNLYHNVH